jgi:hypothetical protein
MDAKVTEVLGVALVFTFPVIASLGINECMCFMLSYDRRDGFVHKGFTIVFTKWR